MLPHTELFLTVLLVLYARVGLKYSQLFTNVALASDSKPSSLADDLITHPNRDAVTPSRNGLSNSTSCTSNEH